MKHHLKGIILFFGAIMLFTTCKKEVSTTSDTQKASTASLSSQLAVSLYRSFTGAYGGANINDGIALPKAATSGRRGLAVNGQGSTLCGFTIDTTFSDKYVVHDTVRSLDGNFKFVYNCSSDYVDGYTVTDDLLNVEAGKLFINKYAVKQNYIVKALDLTYKLVSMNGTSGLLSYLGVITPGQGTTSYYQVTSSYVLTDLKVDFSSGVADVVSGVARFTTLVKNVNSSSPDGNPKQYNGVITFLGNHTAKLEIKDGGGSYMVNLLTGAVTTI